MAPARPAIIGVDGGVHVAQIRHGAVGDGKRAGLAQFRQETEQVRQLPIRERLIESIGHERAIHHDARKILLDGAFARRWAVAVILVHRHRDARGWPGRT